MGKTENQILELLENCPHTLVEIAEELEKKPKVVFRSLRKLFEQGKIVVDPETRCYAPAEE